MQDCQGRSNVLLLPSHVAVVGVRAAPGTGKRKQKSSSARPLQSDFEEAHGVAGSFETEGLAHSLTQELNVRLT